MYNNPFYMPGYSRAFLGPSLARGLPASMAANTARSSGGLLSRLLPGLSGIRKINWGTLINNTSRTLGLINQTIPIVKQAGPMINNMKSMVRVASLFKDETDGKKQSQTNINQNNQPTQKNTNNFQNPNFYQKSHQKEETSFNYQNNEDNVSPTFFVGT